MYRQIPVILLKFPHKCKVYKGENESCANPADRIWEADSDKAEELWKGEGCREPGHKLKKCA